MVRLPLQPTSQEILEQKYILKDSRQNKIDKDLDDIFDRTATALSKVEKQKQSYWKEKFKWALYQGATPGGRIVSNAGAEKYKPAVSLINCTMSQTVKDSMESILHSNMQAGITLKAGCGIGYEFSTLRPNRAFVNGAGAFTSGPLSFMEIFDATTLTVSSAGGRRGAQMGTFAVWHPDVISFITAKRENGKLRQFNLSLLIDDDFMEAVKKDADWHLVFPITPKEEEYKLYEDDKVIWKDLFWEEEYCREMGYQISDDFQVKCKIYDTIKARELWNIIMQSTYDFAEPGFLLISRINEMNNNYFCEEIRGTNPCFTGDTIVATADGRNGVTIKQLAEESEGKNKFKVYSARHALRQSTFTHWKAEIKDAVAFKTGTKEIVEVLLSDGTSFRCTPDHLIATKDGKYVEAQHLEGQTLAKFYTYANKNVRKAPRYINSKSNGYSKQYRMMWEEKFGTKPEGYDIDHIDSDASNDRLENLQILTKEEHAIKTKNSRLGKGNTVHRLLNKERYIWLQRKKGLKSNAVRHNWSDEKYNEKLNKFLLENPEPLVEDNNVDMNYSVEVEEVIWTGEVEDVYDLTVEDNHNFYIITNTDDENFYNCAGVLVHNCGEQPLPPEGSCLLGSINLALFVEKPFTKEAYFNWEKYKEVIEVFSRMLDNVVELNGLPLENQRHEIEYKRRHGMGYLGLGSALSLLGMTYGSEESLEFVDEVTKVLAVESYRAGIELAKEKGPAPIFNDDFTYKGETKNAKEWWVESKYLQNIWNEAPELKEEALKYGCRYTHATSIAPTGTIALTINNNVSGGIEPSFTHKFTRNVIKEGKKAKIAQDVFSYEMLLYKEITGKDEVPEEFSTTDNVSYQAHVDVQAVAQKWIDSSISKTINVPTDTQFEEFKDIYMYAYDKGLKGATTFRWNPETLQGVLVKDSDLGNTFYKFELEDGSVVEARADDKIEYEGDIYQANNLYDAFKEGMYGKY